MKITSGLIGWIVLKSELIRDSAGVAGVQKYHFKRF